MADWLIKIVADGDGCSAFVPSQPGAGPGSALKAFEDDTVTFNNTTGEAHWPWPTDETFTPWADDKVSKDLGTYLSGEIPPHRPSDVIFNVPEITPPPPAKPSPFGPKIYYYCKLHHNEHGSIEVQKVPPKTTS